MSVPFFRAGRLDCCLTGHGGLDRHVCAKKGGLREYFRLSRIGIALSSRPGFEIDVQAQGCWKERR